MESLDNIASVLCQKDNFYILTHQYPDGDTLGSAYALCRALQKLGKKAKVLNNDEISGKYSYLFDEIENQEFEAECIVSVDVASTNLLGGNLEKYKDKINIKIDHHVEKYTFSELSYIDAKAAATTEIIYDLINSMKIEIDELIADAIYTGLSTDTGCFKYINVTPKTHIIAARTIELGAKHAFINKIMFDTKSKNRLELEKLVYDSISYHFDSKCAVIYITNQMLEKASINDDSEIDGFASIPRKIEGVLIGVTIREKEENNFKISLRTDGKIDASVICAKFGGGGHKAASGCTIKGTLNEAKAQILQEIKNELENILC